MEMDCRSHRWKMFPAVVIAGVVLGLSTTGCKRKPAPAKSPVPIDSLRAALQRSADATLPNPTLVNRRFDLQLKSEEIPAKAAEIIQIAGQLQGTVLTSSPSDRLLISLPADRVSQFAARALKQEAPDPAGETGTAAILVEVILAPEPSLLLQP